MKDQWKWCRLTILSIHIEIILFLLSVSTYCHFHENVNLIDPFYFVGKCDICITWEGTQTAFYTMCIFKGSPNTNRLLENGMLLFQFPYYINLMSNCAYIYSVTLVTKLCTYVEHFCQRCKVIVPAPLNASDRYPTGWKIYWFHFREESCCTKQYNILAKLALLA